MNTRLLVLLLIASALLLLSPSRCEESTRVEESDTLPVESTSKVVVLTREPNVQDKTVVVQPLEGSQNAKSKGTYVLRKKGRHHKNAPLNYTVVTTEKTSLTQQGNTTEQIPSVDTTDKISKNQTQVVLNEIVCVDSQGYSNNTWMTGDTAWNFHQQHQDNQNYYASSCQHSGAIYCGFTIDVSSSEVEIKAKAMIRDCSTGECGVFSMGKEGLVRLVFRGGGGIDKPYIDLLHQVVSMSGIDTGATPSPEPVLNNVTASTTTLPPTSSPTPSIAPTTTPTSSPTPATVTESDDTPTLTSSPSMQPVANTEHKHKKNKKDSYKPHKKFNKFRRHIVDIKEEGNDSKTAAKITSAPEASAVNQREEIHSVSKQNAVASKIVPDIKKSSETSYHSESNNKKLYGSYQPTEEEEEHEDEDLMNDLQHINDDIKQHLHKKDKQINELQQQGGENKASARSSDILKSSSMLTAFLLDGIEGVSHTHSQSTTKQVKDSPVKPSSDAILPKEDAEQDNTKPQEATESVPSDLALSQTAPATASNVPEPPTFSKEEKDVAGGVTFLDKLIADNLEFQLLVTIKDGKIVFKVDDNVIAQGDFEAESGTFVSFGFRPKHGCIDIRDFKAKSARFNKIPHFTIKNTSSNK